MPSTIELNVTSTEYLQLIAKNDFYIFYEKAAPAGRLKREFISIKSKDGRSPFTLPRLILEDYIRLSLVVADGPEDEDGRIIYRLTRDGRARGLS